MFFNNSDVVIFTETWSDKDNCDLFVWDDDFEEKFREFGLRNSRRRSSGGISFCARKVLEREYKIPSSSAYRNKTNNLILNLTPENVTQHSRICMQMSHH